MAIKIGPQEIAKISGETGISVDMIQKIFSLGLLNEKRALDLAIRYDYKRMARGPRKNRLRPKDIKEALATYYNVPLHRVINTISHPQDRYFFCPECGRSTSAKDLKSHGGVCFKCALDELNRDLDEVDLNN